MMKHPILQCPFSHSWNTWIESFIPLYHIDGSKRVIALKYNNVYDPRCGLIRVTKDKVRDTCHLYKNLISARSITITIIHESPGHSPFPPSQSAQ